MQTKQEMTKNESELHFATKAAVIQTNGNPSQHHLSELQSNVTLPTHSLPRLLLPQQFAFSPLYFDTHAINQMNNTVYSDNNKSKSNITNGDNKITSSVENDKDNKNKSFETENSSTEGKSNLIKYKVKNYKEFDKTIDNIERTNSGGSGSNVKNNDCQQSKTTMEYTHNERRYSIDDKESNENIETTERDTASKNYNNNIDNIDDNNHDGRKSCSSNDDDDDLNDNKNIITDKEEVFYQHFIYGQSHPPVQRQQPAYFANNIKNKINSKLNHNNVSHVNSTLLTNNNTPLFSEISPLPYYREEENVPTHINTTNYDSNNINTTGVMKRLENTPLWREKQKQHTKTNTMQKERKYNVFSSATHHSNSHWESNNINNKYLSVATSPPVTRSFVLRQQEAQRREDQRRAMVEAAAEAEEELHKAQALGQMSKIWHRSDNNIIDKNEDKHVTDNHTNVNEKEKAAFINTPPSSSLQRPTRSTLLRASFTAQQLQRIEEKNTQHNYTNNKYHQMHRPVARRSQSADVVKTHASSLSVSSLPRRSSTNELSQNKTNKVYNCNDNDDDMDEVHEIYSRNSSNDSNSAININNRSSALEKNEITNNVNMEKKNAKDENVNKNRSNNHETTFDVKNKGSINYTAATKSTLLRKMYNEQRLSEMEKTKEEIEEDEQFWQAYRDGKISPRRRSISKMENISFHNKYNVSDKYYDDSNNKYVIIRRRDKSVMSTREPHVKMSVTRRSVSEHVSPSRTATKTINRATTKEEKNDEHKLKDTKQNNKLSTLQRLEECQQQIQQMHKNANESNNSQNNVNINVIETNSSSALGEIHTYSKDHETGAIRSINYDTINSDNNNNERIQLNRTARLRQEYITAKENEWRAEMEEETAKRNAILLGPSPARQIRHSHQHLHSQSSSQPQQTINNTDEEHKKQKESELSEQREKINETPRTETKSALLRKEHNTNQRKQQQEKEQKNTYHHHHHHYHHRKERVKEEMTHKDNVHLTPRHVDKEKQRTSETTQNDKDKNNKNTNNGNSDDDDIHLTIEENETVSVNNYSGDVVIEMNNDDNVVVNREQYDRQEHHSQEIGAERNAENDSNSSNNTNKNEAKNANAQMKENKMTVPHEANVNNETMFKSEDAKWEQSLPEELEHFNKEEETKRKYYVNTSSLTGVIAEAKSQECMMTSLPPTNNTVSNKINEVALDMNVETQKVVNADTQANANVVGVKLSPTHTAPLSILPLLSAHKVQQEEECLHKSVNVENKIHNTYTRATSNINTNLCKLNDDMIQNVNNDKVENKHNTDKPCNVIDQNNVFSDENMAITKVVHSARNGNAVVPTEQQTLPSPEKETKVQSHESIKIESEKNSNETSTNVTNKVASSRQRTRRHKISALSLVYMFDMQCNSNNKCYERYFHRWMCYASSQKLANYEMVKQSEKQEQLLHSELQQQQQQQSKASDTLPTQSNNVIAGYGSNGNNSNRSKDDEIVVNDNKECNFVKGNSTLTHKQESKEKELEHEKKIEPIQGNQEIQAETKGNNELTVSTSNTPSLQTLLPSPSPTSVLHENVKQTAMKEDNVHHEHESDRQVKENTKSTTLSLSSASSTLPLTSSSHLSSASFLSTRLPSHKTKISKLSVATLANSKNNIDNNNNKNKEGDVIATTPLQRWRERQRQNEIKATDQRLEEKEKEKKKSFSEDQHLTSHFISTLSHRVRSNTTQNNKSDKDISSITTSTQETFVYSISNNSTSNNINKKHETSTFTETVTNVNNDKDNVISNSNLNSNSIETTPSDLISTPFLTEVAKVSDDVCVDVASDNVTMKEKEEQQSKNTETKINVWDKVKGQNSVDEHVNTFATNMQLLPEDEKQEIIITNQDSVENQRRMLESLTTTDVSNVTNELMNLNNEKSRNNNGVIIGEISNCINQEATESASQDEPHEQRIQHNRSGNKSTEEKEKQYLHQQEIEPNEKKESINDKDFFNNVIECNSFSKDVSKSESHRNSYLSTFSYSGGTIEEIEQEVPDVLEVNLAAEMIEEEINNELKLQQRVRAQAPTPRMSIYSDTEDKNSDSVYSINNNNNRSTNNMNSSNDSNLSANYNSSDPFDDTDAISEIDSSTNTHDNPNSTKLPHEEEEEEKCEAQSLLFEEKYQELQCTYHLQGTNDSQYVNVYDIKGNAYTYKNNEDAKTMEQQESKRYLVNNENEIVEEKAMFSDKTNVNTNQWFTSGDFINNGDREELACINKLHMKQTVENELTAPQENDKIKHSVNNLKETEIQKTQMEEEEKPITKTNEHPIKATNHNNNGDERCEDGAVVNANTATNRFTLNKNVSSCNYSNHHSNKNDDGNAFLFEVTDTQTNAATVASPLQKTNVVDNNEFNGEHFNNKHDNNHHVNRNTNRNGNIYENGNVNNDNRELVHYNKNVNCNYKEDDIYNKVDIGRVNVLNTVLNGSERQTKELSSQEVSVDKEDENDTCNENKECLISHKDMESLQRQWNTKRKSDASDEERLSRKVENNISNMEEKSNGCYVGFTKMNDNSEKSEHDEHVETTALPSNENMYVDTINSVTNEINPVKDETVITIKIVDAADKDQNYKVSSNNSTVISDKQLNYVHCTHLSQPQLPLSSITSSPLFSPCTLKEEQQQEEEFQEQLNQQYNVKNTVASCKYGVILEQQRPPSPIPLALEKTNGMESSQRTEECYWSASGSPSGSDNDNDDDHDVNGEGVKVVPVKVLPSVTVVNNCNESESNNTVKQSINKMFDGVNVVNSANDDTSKSVDNNAVKYNCNHTTKTQNDNNNDNENGDDNEEGDEVRVTFIHRTQLTNVQQCESLHSLEPSEVEERLEDEHQNELLHKEQQLMSSRLCEFNESSWSTRADSEDLHSITSIDVSNEDADVE